MLLVVSSQITYSGITNRLTDMAPTVHRHVLLLRYQTCTRGGIYCNPGGSTCSSLCRTPEAAAQVWHQEVLQGRGAPALAKSLTSSSSFFLFPSSSPRGSATASPSATATAQWPMEVPFWSASRGLFFFRARRSRRPRNVTGFTWMWRDMTAHGTRRPQNGSFGLRSPRRGETLSVDRCLRSLTLQSRSSAVCRTVVDRRFLLWHGEDRRPGGAVSRVGRSPLERSAGRSGRSFLGERRKAEMSMLISKWAELCGTPTAWQ